MKHHNIMTCTSCGWKVMETGDWSGWKAVGDPEDGNLFWYCHKETCLEQYQIRVDEIIYMMNL